MKKFLIATGICMVLAITSFVAVYFYIQTLAR